LGVKKVISGGQTGVDRAALAAGVPVGGWCPRGRLAEDGIIDAKYPLRETPSSAYSQRTEWNVRDSDETLVLYRSRLSGGSRLTWYMARKHGKPCRAFDLDQEMPADLSIFREDVVLNIAGPRESQAPGIYQAVYNLLFDLFAG